MLNRLDEAALEKLVAHAELDLHQPAPPASPRRAAPLIEMADGDGPRASQPRGTGRRFVFPWKVDGQLTRDQLATPPANAAPRNTTSRARRITTSSPRCTNPSAAPTQTRRSYLVRPDARGRRRPPATSPAASPAWRSRIFGLADPAAQRHCLDALGLPMNRLGSPRGRAGAGAGRPLPRPRPQIERGLCRLQGRPRQPPRSTGSGAAAKHILNAPTKMMKEQGYGCGLRL